MTVECVRDTGVGLMSVQARGGGAPDGGRGARARARGARPAAAAACCARQPPVRRAPPPRLYRAPPRRTTPLQVRTTHDTLYYLEGDTRHGGRAVTARSCCLATRNSRWRSTPPSSSSIPMASAAGAMTRVFVCRLTENP